VFAGVVKYVGDGDSLCVGSSSDARSWIEVRLADFDAPELSTTEGKRGKAILEHEAIGRQVSCTVTKGRNGKTTTYDRVLAVCSIGGTTIGAALRNADAPSWGQLTARHRTGLVAEVGRPHPKRHRIPLLFFQLEDTDFLWIWIYDPIKIGLLAEFERHAAVVVDQNRYIGVYQF
jgi:hypothetical protein